MSKKQTTSLKNMVDRQRFHVAATVTQEGQWPQSEPNQGLARMFVIMLLVHVVIIGGIIIYDFVGESGESHQASASTKPTTAKETSTASRAAAHLPVVADTAPAAVPTPVSAESLLTEAIKNDVPLAAAQVPVSTPPAPVPDEELPKAQAFTPPAPAMLTSRVPSSEEPKSHVSIVSLPPAPRAELAEITTSTGPAVKSEPPIAKPVVTTRSEEPRRALPISDSVPKPVATPSAARKSLENERRAQPAPVVKRKIEAAPPAPKKKTDGPSVVTKKATPKASAGSRHTVGKGDTLYGIARRYKTTTDAIVKANSIKNPNVLTDGKVLIIPGK